MVNGLTKKEAKSQLNFHSRELEGEANYLKELSKTIDSTANNVAEVIPNVSKNLDKLKDDLRKSLEIYAEFQKQQKQIIEQLKNQKKADADILALKERNKQLEEDAKRKRDEALSHYLSKVTEIAEDNKLGDQQKDYYLKKQIAVLEKSFKMDEAFYSKRLQRDRDFHSTMVEIEKQRKEEAKQRRAEHGSNLLKAGLSLLAPLRMITDPLLTIATGKNTVEFFGGGLQGRALSDKRKAKRDYKRSLKELDAEESQEERLNDLEDGLYKVVETEKKKKRGKGLGRDKGSFQDQSVLTSIGSDSHREFSFSGEEDTDIMDKITPDESVLLSKGGVVGAGFVYLARQMGVGQLKGKKSAGREGGLLSGLLGTALDFLPGRRFRRGVRGRPSRGAVRRGRALRKFGRVAKKFALPAALIAAGGAMMYGAHKLQRRDSADAQQYTGARRAETWLLGDREHTTEETRLQELGRTTGKTGLALGGAGLAATGGAMALGKAGLVAAGAAAGPIGWAALAVAAVGTGVIATVKGVQQAFHLEHDKNIASIQADLRRVMYDDSSSLGEKMKAGLQSAWTGFTSCLAGGVRGASEVINEANEAHLERQREFLQDQVAAGSQAHINLSTVLQSEDYLTMSDSDRERHLKNLGLFDTYKDMQKLTKEGGFQTALNAAGGFFSGIGNTAIERYRGTQTARWERDALKGKTFASHDEKEAYLAEMRQKAIEQGIMREDGILNASLNPFADIDFSGVRETFDNMGAFFRNTGSNARTFFGDSRNNVNNFLGGARDNVGGFFNDTKDNVSNFFGGVGDRAGNLFGSAKENIGNFFGNARSGVSNFFGGAKDKIKGLYGNAKEKVGNFFSGLIQEDSFLADKYGMVRDGVGVLFDKVRGFTEEFIEDPRGTTKRILGKGLENVRGGIISFLDSAGSFVENLGKKPDIIPRRGLTRLTEGIGNFFANIGAGIVSGWNTVQSFFGGGSSPHTENDAVITKDGQVISLHPDDNIYATTNRFNVQDQSLQAAMPSIPRPAREFTDVGIIQAINTLTEIMRNKEMQPVVIPPESNVNFEQYRVAHSLG